MQTLPIINNSKQLKAHNNKHYQYECKHIGELLVDANVITPLQLKETLLQQNNSSDKRLGELLLQNGLVNQEQVDIALCQRFGVAFVNLRQFDIDPNAVKCFPAAFARKHTVMPLLLEGDTLMVAITDPTNTDLVNMMRFVTEKILEISVALPEDIAYAISTHFGNEEAQTALELLDTSANVEPFQVEASIDERLGEERPIVQLVQNLLMDATVRRASDIHIQPREKLLDILFRIDGVLQNIQSFNKNLLPALVSRIKIIGNMDISEHRLPQDGRSRVRYMGKEIDLRLSVIPSIYGESVVIRLLDTEFALSNLEELGFHDQDATTLRHLLSQTNGVFLVTGPTGSGKSTTLYTALDHIKKTKVNIITVEDPVEYHMDKITQIQINEHTGYTFAKALRHILRHDPDVIMVGEIRDQETAKMAIESALTGHLVLSTLHTNSAASTVTRLLEIGVEPYLVTSTLLGVLAQRLVRRNCPHCLEEESVDASVRELLGASENDIFYQGKGCDRCHQTGIHGRRAVYELLSVSQEMKALLKPGVSNLLLQQQAIKDGMTPLTEQALRLAKEKTISLSEVYRVRLS